MIRKFMGKYVGKWVSRRLAGALGASVAIEEAGAGLAAGEWRIIGHAAVWITFLICQTVLDRTAMIHGAERVELEQPADQPETA